MHVCSRVAPAAAAGRKVETSGQSGSRWHNCSFQRQPTPLSQSRGERERQGDTAQAVGGTIVHFTITKRRVPTAQRQGGAAQAVGGVAVPGRRRVSALVCNEPVEAGHFVKEQRSRADAEARDVTKVAKGDQRRRVARGAVDLSGGGAHAARSAQRQEGAEVAEPVRQQRRENEDLQASDTSK